MSVYVGLSGKAIQVQVDRKQMFRTLKQRVSNASSHKEGKKKKKRVEGVGLKNKIIKMWCLPITMHVCPLGDRRTGIRGYDLQKVLLGFKKPIRVLDKKGKQVGGPANYQAK